MKRTLEEILAENSDLVKLLLEIEEDELEGVDTAQAREELNEKLSINRNELETKLDAYYYISEKLKAEAEFDKQQEERFSKRKKAKLNSSQRLKDRIDLALTLYGTPDPKSKAKIPSLKFKTNDVSYTAIAYPIVDPTTIPPVEEIENEIPGQYIDYTILAPKLSQSEAKLMIKALNVYNEKVGSKEGILAFVPAIKPNLNLDSIKAALKEGIEVAELKLLNNFKTRCS